MYDKINKHSIKTTYNGVMLKVQAATYVNYTLAYFTSIINDSNILSYLDSEVLLSVDDFEIFNMKILHIDSTIDHLLNVLPNKYDTINNLRLELKKIKNTISEYAHIFSIHATKFNVIPVYNAINKVLLGLREFIQYIKNIKTVYYTDVTIDTDSKYLPVQKFDIVDIKTPEIIERNIKYVADISIIRFLPTAMTYRVITNKNDEVSIEIPHNQPISNYLLMNGIKFI